MAAETRANGRQPGRQGAAAAQPTHRTPSRPPHAGTPARSSPSPPARSGSTRNSRRSQGGAARPHSQSYSRHSYSNSRRAHSDSSRRHARAGAGGGHGGGGGGGGGSSSPHRGSSAGRGGRHSRSPASHARHGGQGGAGRGHNRSRTPVRHHDEAKQQLRVLGKEVKALKEDNTRRNKDERKWNKKGVEHQYNFNNKAIRAIENIGSGMEDFFHDQFDASPPDSLEDLVQQGKKLLVDRNHELKIVDEFDWEALETWNGEELARNEKEEKKLISIRKQYKDKRATGTKPDKDADSKKPFERRGRWQESNANTSGRRTNVQCNACSGYGHYARDCHSTGYPNRTGREGQNGRKDHGGGGAQYTSAGGRRRH
jgi:hypothetical protein